MSLSSSRLLVVIVNFRVADLTIGCLQSIALEIDSVSELRVVVCENGSGDDSAQRIQAAIKENGWCAWCNLIVSEVNTGFTGGNNIILRPAIESASPPNYFLLLNPDTIVRPGAFSALVDFMEANPRVGVAGSRLEDPDGTPQRSAFRFQTPFSEFESNIKLGLVSKLLNRWIVAPPVREVAHQADWVSGASLIARCEVFRQVGLLDEGYFTYFDDIDLCFRTGKSGWETWYVPASRVVHLGGQSTGVSNANLKRLPQYLLAARRRYFLKNHGALYALCADIGMISGAALWNLRRMITREPDRNPKSFLIDALRQSVLLNGFSLKDVPNSVSREK